jgi:hypothetical protein
MYKFAIILLGTACLAVTSGFSSGHAATLPQIWFSPRQDSVDMTQPPGHRISFTKMDFPSMLPANAPWQTAASRISVLAIGAHTMELYDGLASVVAMTDRYKFKIATAGGMISTDGLCAKNGVEGLDSLSKNFAGEVVNATKIWKMHGGRLDHVIMDSPFYFGYYASAKDCHYSIAEVARRAAATFREIQKYYPKIQVMDAEGPGATPINAWLPDFKQWLDDFKAEAGHPIDAVGMDFHWRDAWHTGYNWVDAVRTTSAFLHKQGISVGLYIDAEDQGVTSAQWMSANREHLKTAMTSGSGLDFYYIVSWMKFPDRNLPESDPSAYTSLVNDAFNSIQSRSAQ